MPSLRARAPEIGVQLPPMGDPGELKALALNLAGELGFACAGVAPAGPAARPGRFERFLASGWHAEMAWLPDWAL